MPLLPLPSEKELRALLAANGASMLNEQLLQLSVPTIALLTFGLSASDVSLILSALWFAPLLLSAATGWLVDTFEHKKLLIASSLLTLAAGISLSCIVIVHPASALISLMACTALYSVGNLLFTITSSATLPTTLRSIPIAEAASLKSLVTNVSRVAGQGIAGPFTQLFGVLFATVGMIFLSLVKLLTLTRLTSSVAARDLDQLPAHADEISAWKIAWEDLTCRYISAATLVMTLGGAIIFGQFFPFVYKSLGLTTLDVGLIMFSGGLSAIVTAKVFMSRLSSMSTLRICAIGGLIASLAVWLIPLASFGHPRAILTTYEIIFSFASTIFAIAFYLLVQEMVPNKKLGRLVSVLTTVSSAGMVGGTLIAAGVSAVYGVMPTILLGCALSSLGAFCLVGLASSEQSTRGTGDSELDSKIV